MDMFVLFLCIWCVCVCVLAYIHACIRVSEKTLRIQCLMFVDLPQNAAKTLCQPCVVQQPLDSVDHSMALWLSAIVE